MSKDNYSRIPMRGLGSRIPMPGSVSTQTKAVTSLQKANQIASTKITRSSDIGLILGSMQHDAETPKKSSSTNSTRMMARSYSSDKIPSKGTSFGVETTKASQFQSNAASHTIPQEVEQNEDQMLINETIELVGSEENVSRVANRDASVGVFKENLTFNQPNPTSDLCRRDGTFIKSPTMTFNVTESIESASCFLDSKESTTPAAMPKYSHRSVSKSRDSLNHIAGNYTRMIQLHQNGDHNMFLNKSPDWGSEDMLTMSLNKKKAIFNAAAVKNQLIDKKTCRQRPNFSEASNNNECVSENLCSMTVDCKTNEAMEVDATAANVTMRVKETSQDDINSQKRFSFGLDFTECTLDCSFELVDASIGSMIVQKSPMDKQGSFEVDESLGILTPDQMKEFLDSTATNCNTNNLDLPLISSHKLSHMLRMDQTPSPEELPLDPVGVESDLIDDIFQSQSSHLPTPSTSSNQEISQTESDPKTEMTKSATSKVSNSIITSITSVTSLELGYIGDGELSRPASRGSDQSPSKVSRNILANPIVWNPALPPVHRRIDPMTDSDFFTESDAEDIHHQRENQRRAQVIDGQLYGPMNQGSNVFIEHQPPIETDSCMESSGVFTDFENRGDDDLINRLAVNRENAENPSDMSPDLSSDTINSSHTECSQKKLNTATSSLTQDVTTEHQRDFTIETSSSMGDVVDFISDRPHENKKGKTKDSLQDQSSGNSSTKNTANVKKLGNNRKSHKNEANLGLKKHELTSCSGVKAKTSSYETFSSNTTKKCLNGKWDSVMNKIAENKSVKKSFDNVKSKVTCGVVKRDLPAKVLIAQNAVSTNTTAEMTKNITTGPTSNKRNRTSSKDSQQSSHSDLSINVSKVTRNVRGHKVVIRLKMGAHGSKDKLHRSASERFDRNQVIERERFGSFGKRAKKEVPKKQRDVRTINSSSCDISAARSSNNGTSGSNEAQKTNSRPTLPLHKRSSLYQNGVTTSELKSSPPAKKDVCRRLTDTVASPQEKTPLKDQSRFVANGSPRATLRSTFSSASATTPPNIKKTCNLTNMLENLKVSPKSKIKELQNNNVSTTVNKNNSNGTKKQHQVLQKLLDQQLAYKQNQLDELIHANKGVEALGVLVQYLVFNLDAFSCHSMSKALQETSKQLTVKCASFDELAMKHQSMIEQLNEQREYFTRREEELKESHLREIANAQKLLEDLEKEKHKKMKAFANDLKCQQDSANNMLLILTKEAESKIATRDAELFSAKDHESNLVKRLQELTATENELREKVHTSEIEFSEKLKLSSAREQSLISKSNFLTKQLDDMKLRSDNEKRELEEKLYLSKDELMVTLKARHSIADKSFSNKTINLNQSQLLEDEVESLRCVLELKQSEISDLRKQNAELQRAADESFAAQAKSSALESRVEDLQVQLGARHEEEKELLIKLKQIQDQHDGIMKKSTRLALHNEELQWRLKQNAERYSHTISELSKSYQEQSSFSSNRSNELDTSGGRTSLSITDYNSEISPPSSPVIKGVVEKSDSVSWVLEMDDETPEVLANRLVRKAGSFRSDKCSPFPVQKKQKFQNNSCIQQSASATSILRQCSDASQTKITENTRLRSKSLSGNKSEQPRKIVRSCSNHGTKNHDLVVKSSMSSSSCFEQETKSDISADELKIDEDKNDIFLDGSVVFNIEDDAFCHHGTSNFEPFAAASSFFRDDAPEFKKTRENRRLITCDTAALGSVDLQKMQSPKVGAGEAMISGSNSENEGEISDLSSSTVSTAPSSPLICCNSSLHSNRKNMTSIDGLLQWKSNTPIEVSWCDENGPSESSV